MRDLINTSTFSQVERRRRKRRFQQVDNKLTTLTSEDRRKTQPSAEAKEITRESVSNKICDSNYTRILKSNIESSICCSVTVINLNNISGLLQSVNGKRRGTASEWRILGRWRPSFVSATTNSKRQSGRGTLPLSNWPLTSLQIPRSVFNFHQQGRACIFPGLFFCFCCYAVVFVLYAIKRKEESGRTCLRLWKSLNGNSVSNSVPFCTLRSNWLTDVCYAHICKVHKRLYYVYAHSVFYCCPRSLILAAL